MEVYKISEGNDFDKIYEVSSTLKKINNILIEKYNDILENPDFEQDYCSRTAVGIYKIGHECIRLRKWLTYYDRSCYENINYYDLMGSNLNCLNDIPGR